MNYNNDEIQYDSCIARGICSTNPRTAALQEMLLIYLKVTAFYAKKIYDYGNIEKNPKNTILNTISMLVSNPNFSENDYNSLTKEFQDIIPEIEQIYLKKYNETNEKIEYFKSILEKDKENNIIKSIQLGEKELKERISQIKPDILNMYKILFIIAKSLCINILNLESFGVYLEKGYKTILTILTSIDLAYRDAYDIKSLVEYVAQVDNFVMRKLRNIQEEQYGYQIETEVSYSTKPGKAVLVVGSNIKELDIILNALKDTEIDIYTHGEMMVANTFPHFQRYKNLQGQYGHGLDNCLIDFATFPGPIILTRHSLYNVEHLYRGRLFTTDKAYSKGVIPIKNNDFSEVIKSAQESKGFKTGKQCESVKIGFCSPLLLQKLFTIIQDYSRVIMLGQGGNSIEQQTYFEKLKSLVPKNVLIISLAGTTEQENIINMNACFDTLAMARIAEKIKEIINIPMTLYFPECDNHSISQMIYLKEFDNMDIYIGKCTPILFNPSLTHSLEEIFDIKSQTTIKEDLAIIFDKK